MIYECVVWQTHLLIRPIIFHHIEQQFMFEEKVTDVC